jgi:hypothetical protein
VNEATFSAPWKYAVVAFRQDVRPEASRSFMERRQAACPSRKRGRTGRE